MYPENALFDKFPGGSRIQPNKRTIEMRKKEEISIGLKMIYRSIVIWTFENCI